jgi:hypothetical protein
VRADDVLLQPLPQHYRNAFVRLEEPEGVVAVKLDGAFRLSYFNPKLARRSAFTNYIYSLPKL